MRTVSLLTPLILLIACLLTLPACGQKGPLTLPQDKPAETQAEEQAPPENQAREDDDGTTRDNGTDEHGENDGDQ